jgi:hypothetical protein
MAARRRHSWKGRLYGQRGGGVVITEAGNAPNVVGPVYIAKTVMTYIFVLTAGALLPALLALYDIQETWIWRSSGMLFALPMLSLQVTYPLRTSSESWRFYIVRLQKPHDR